MTRKLHAGGCGSPADPHDIPSFDGLIRDKVTEHPKTINVLKRFNLYPELIVGSAKRIFDQVTKSFNITTNDCWEIYRGEGKNTVQSCVGKTGVIF